MAANLGLVAHAAERHAHELAAGGLGDRLAERRLAHAGRTDEAQDGRLQLVDALLHREILDDALLDLLEAVVILVEDAHGVREVLADLALLAPRQGRERVDERAHDGRFGGHGRHHLELLELGHRLGFRLLRHARGLDLLLHLLEVGVLVALAQFLLDGLDLLVQVVLALALLHLALDAAADALLDLQDVDLALDDAEEVLEPLADLAHLEDLLLLFELKRKVRGDGIGQTAAIVDARHRREDLRRDLLVELDVLVELREQRTAHRLDLVGAARIARQRNRLGDEVFAAVGDARDARTLRALDQHLHGAVGQLQHLQDGRDAADLVEVGRTRVVLRRLLLGDEQDVLAGVHRHVERLDRLGTSDEQRDDHVRKHDDVAQRQQRQRRNVGRQIRFLGHWAAFGGGYAKGKWGRPTGVSTRRSDYTASPLVKQGVTSAPPPSWAGRRT